MEQVSKRVNHKSGDFLPGKIELMGWALVGELLSRCYNRYCLLFKNESQKTTCEFL